MAQYCINSTLSTRLGFLIEACKETSEGAQNLITDGQAMR